MRGGIWVQHHPFLKIDIFAGSLWPKSFVSGRHSDVTVKVASFGGKFAVVT